MQIFDLRWSKPFLWICMAPLTFRQHLLKIYLDQPHKQSWAGLLSSCSHLSYLASDAPSPCQGPPELLTKSKNQNLNLKKTECRKLKSNQDLPRSCPTSDEGRTAELIPLLHNINRPAKVTRPLRISRVWLTWHRT